MFFGVRHHRGSGYKSFSATLASVWPFAGVETFVYCHGRELGERLPAEVAAVGSFSGVRPPVTPQGVSSSESFAAHLADVRFFTRVHRGVNS